LQADDEKMQRADNINQWRPNNDREGLRCRRKSPGEARRLYACRGKGVGYREVFETAPALICDIRS
jgi:hypothetical protein